MAKYNTELCEALASFGHEVHAVTAPPYYPEWSIPRAYRGWRYRSETINGVSITRSPIYVPDNPTGAKRLLHHASFALSSAWPVISTSLRWRPDIVFSVAPSLMSAALSAGIGRRVRRAFVASPAGFRDRCCVRSRPPEQKAPESANGRAERKILRSFDCVSTISPQCSTDWRQGRRQGKDTRDSQLDRRQPIAPGNRRHAFRKDTASRRFAFRWPLLRDNVQQARARSDYRGGQNSGAA